MIKQILYISFFFQCFAICCANNAEAAQPVSQKQIAGNFKFDNPMFDEALMHFILKYVIPSYFNLEGQSDVLSRLKEIVYKQNTVSLSLEYCKLECLPSELGDFVNLVYLDLRGNGLKELPVWISKLSKLKYLDLSDNKLTTLPKSLKNLKCLEVINLSNNQFFEFPAMLWKLKGCIPIINFHSQKNPIE